MPCYDGRDRETIRIVHESGVSPAELEAATKQKRWAEAALCSLINELEKRGIAAEVIAESSRNGLIGLMDFWTRHSKNDDARIAKILHGYSKDEQAVMRKLLATKAP